MAKLSSQLNLLQQDIGDCAVAWPTKFHFLENVIFVQLKEREYYTKMKIWCFFFSFLLFLCSQLILFYPKTKYWRCTIRLQRMICSDSDWESKPSCIFLWEKKLGNFQLDPNGFIGACCTSYIRWRIRVVRKYFNVYLILLTSQKYTIPSMIDFV